MSISQVPADGGVNPLKDQQINQVAKGIKSEGEKEKGKVGGDSVELSEQAKLFQEIEKYKKELENIPNPNDGRINEIKDSIADGSLLSDTVLQETAQRLADQLLS